MNPDGDRNQNTPNGVPNADPAQQAIFTPNSDPTSSNQPQNSSVVTGSVVEPASTGLSHPYISNHPTQTFTSETGDIIINNTKPQPKNKKVWIIGGIAAVGAAIIVIAVMTILIGNKNGAELGSTTKQQFDSYANYILFGDNNGEFVGSYEQGRAYDIDYQFYEDGFNTSFWDKAEGLLDAAVSSYSENPGDKDLLTFLREYQKRFLFLKSYKRLGELSEEQLLQTVLDSGLGGATNYVNNFYSEIKAANYNEEANNVIDAKVQQYQAFIDMVGLYMNYGCIQGETLNETCATELNNDEHTMQLSSIMSSSGYQAENSLKIMMQRIGSDCFRIGRQLNELSNEGKAS